MNRRLRVGGQPLDARRPRVIGSWGEIGGPRRSPGRWAWWSADGASGAGRVEERRRAVFRRGRLGSHWRHHDPVIDQWGRRRRVERSAVGMGAMVRPRAVLVVRPVTFLRSVGIRLVTVLAGPFGGVDQRRSHGFMMYRPVTHDPRDPLDRGGQEAREEQHSNERPRAHLGSKRAAIMATSTPQLPWGSFRGVIAGCHCKVFVISHEHDPGRRMSFPRA